MYCMDVSIVLSFLGWLQYVVYCINMKKYYQEILKGDVVICYCILVYFSDVGILKFNVIEFNIVF